MYEQIRDRSVHTMSDPAVSDDAFPHRSREEELDIRLAGYFTALLTITDELRALTPSPEFNSAANRLAVQVARLSDGHPPLRAEPSVRDGSPEHVETLHRRAHTLAGNALVVATARGDVPGESLAASRLNYHAAALGL